MCIYQRVTAVLAQGGNKGDVYCPQCTYLNCLKGF